ncbi:unnamed protein product [Tuber aestivum]|uniref:Uncharacterized protein n=1 Tax=Tuber aestivum TaxID=59557 RepID=A0A292PZG7_9PEZI|nr:unnamed protein product [Tuber aestivum]
MTEDPGHLNPRRFGKYKFCRSVGRSWFQPCCSCLPFSTINQISFSLPSSLRGARLYIYSYTYGYRLLLILLSPTLQCWGSQYPWFQAFIHNSLVALLFNPARVWRVWCRMGRNLRVHSVTGRRRRGRAKGDGTIVRCVGR